MVNTERLSRSPEVVVAHTKLLLFDLYDTSVGLDGTIAEEVRKLSLNIDAIRFASSWGQQYGRLLQEVRNGNVAWADLATLMRNGLEVILPDFGLTDLSQEAKDSLIGAWYQPNPWPDTKDGLERLRQKGYKLATMSNASEEMQKKIAGKIGFAFDAYFSPDKVQVYKPDPKMYQQALNLGFLAHEITMVSHFPPDVITSKNQLGYNSVYVSRSKDPSQSDFIADITVRDFTELADKFGA